MDISGKLLFKLLKVWLCLLVNSVYTVICNTFDYIQARTYTKKYFGEGALPKNCTRLIISCIKFT